MRFDELAIDLLPERCPAERSPSGISLAASRIWLRPI